MTESDLNASIEIKNDPPRMRRPDSIAARTVLTFLRAVFDENYQKGNWHLDPEKEMYIRRSFPENVVLDMQEKEDNYFFKILDAAVNLNGNEFNSTSDYLKKDDFNTLFNMIDTKRLKADTLVMHRATLNDAYRWNYTEVGGLITRSIEDGVEQLKLGGKRLITTSNTDVIDPGVVYVATSPEFFGSAFELGDPTFWMQKDKDLLRMSSWYYAGFNLGNYKSIGKMVLNTENGEEEGGEE